MFERHFSWVYCSMLGRWGRSVAFPASCNIWRICRLCFSERAHFFGMLACHISWQAPYLVKFGDVGVALFVVPGGLRALYGGLYVSRLSNMQNVLVTSGFASHRLLRAARWKFYMFCDCQT